TQTGSQKFIFGKGTKLTVSIT
uniref:Uncharacterized protein n=1 Tax=Cyprinus carpio TaxID=7962 RepID=A0A8C2GXS3_CYPCA